MKQEKWDKLHKELDNALNTIKKNKMKVEKKKVVGLRKKKEPIITVYNPMERDLMKAETVNKLKDEVIADLETRLDEAYKEQEDMLKEVDKWVFQVIHHCAEVESKTGRITLHDVDYCVDLIKRIMKHKFESKPENC
jgi:predicted phage-related endonuclease